MTVASATIEANGYVLAVRGAWGASSFASFDLDKDGSPKVALAIAGPGHDRSGGQAVPNPLRARSCVGIEVLRLPAVPGEAMTYEGGGIRLGAPIGILDEVEHGDGTRTVRIVFSGEVYAGDNVSVTFGAGWRAGEAGGVLAATNDSALVKEIPAFRWACAPHERVDGPFRVDCLVADILPEGKDAVAAIRFTVTDGTRINMVWADGASTSTLYGDGLRCWGATIDPGGLTAGLITVHASIYPWTGAVRHTAAADPAVTPQRVPAADSDLCKVQGLVQAYDPTGARYGYLTLGGTQWTYAACAVDAAGGIVATPATRAAAEAMCGFGNTRAEAIAAARAVATANKASTMQLAGSACVRLARTAPAANGEPARSVMMDGFIVWLEDGLHVPSTTLGTLTGPTTTETWYELDGSGAANVTLRTPASAISSMGARLWKLGGIAFEGGQVHFSMSGLKYLTPGHVVRGKPGYETAAGSFWASGTTLNRWNMLAFSGQWTAAGVGYSGSNQVFSILRSCAHSRPAAALVMANNRFVLALDATIPTGGGMPITNFPYPSALTEDQANDRFIWGNDYRGSRATNSFCVFDRYLTGGYATIRRLVMVNNLSEKYAVATGPVWKYGEQMGPAGTQEAAIGWVVEGNTFVGDRINQLYNDPLCSTLLHTTTINNITRSCRHANNYSDRYATKHDAFEDGIVAALRGGGAWQGFRSHLTQGWQYLFGGLSEGNVDGWRFPGGPLGGATPNGRGLRFRMNPLNNYVDGTGDMTWPGFVSDQSVYGSNAGLGDYRPAVGSPLLGQAVTGCIDVNRDGSARGSSWAAGSEGAAVVSADLAPDAASHPSFAGTAEIAWLGALAVQGGSHATASGDAVLQPGVSAAGDFTPLTRVVEVAADARTVRVELAR